MDLPPVQIVQQWHVRLDADPAQRRLRGAIRQAARGEPNRRNPAPRADIVGRVRIASYGRLVAPLARAAPFLRAFTHHAAAQLGRPVDVAPYASAYPELGRS